MQHGEVSTGAFTLLHRDHLRFQSFNRLNEHTVRMEFPSPTGMEIAELPYSVRERRPLVVLEGDIPEDGLSRHSRQIHQQRLGLLEAHPDEMRKRREYELKLNRPPCLFRRFLILPAGAGICIRYRNRSLAYKYVVLNLAHIQDSTWSLTTQSLSY